MHSRVHAFLTHPRSPGGDTVPENRCWQTADGKNKFPMFQSYRSSAFMGQSSQNFPHSYSTTGIVYRESLRGVTAENVERIAKTREFLHLYRQKRALCLRRRVKGQGRTYTL